MIAIIGRDTIKSLESGRFRAHRLGCWWVGDANTMEEAKCALDASNSDAAKGLDRGIYDGGAWASEDEHNAVMRKRAYRTQQPKIFVFDGEK
jgi:hypothetical protein